jgi:hypothetical protein
MKKLIIITVVLATMFAAGTAQAGISGRRNRSPAVQPAPVAVAPAPIATARTEGGYRTFSYQPAPVYAAPAFGVATRQPVAGSGFQDAGWKVRGF